METSTMRSASQRNRQIRWCSAWIYTVLVVVFIVGVISLLSFQVLRLSAKATVQDSFCCPELARELAKQSNRSINPCTRFLPYTCYHMNDSRLTNRITLLEDLEQSILDGTANSDAGRTLHKYFSSCISTLVSDSKMAEKAAWAIMDASGVREPLSPVDILNVIFGLSIKYDIRFVLWVNFHDYKETGLLSFRPRAEDACKPIQDTEYWEQILLAITSRLSLNVTPAETAAITTQLVTIARDTSPVLRGNSSVLKDLLPRVSFLQWQLVLGRVGAWRDSLRVTVRSARTVQRILDILTDHDRKEVATAALLTAMTCLVAGPSLTHHVNASSHQELFRFCQQQLLIHHALLELAATSQLTNPVKDSIVRGIYNLVLVEVNRTASAAGHNCCADEVSSLMSKFQLILPSDVKFQTPPHMMEYWRNVLSLRRYDVEAGKHRRRMGIPFYKNTSSNALTAYRRGGSLYIIPTAYASLLLPAGVEPFVNAAIIGVAMADALWDALFQETSLNATAFALLTGYRECGYDENIRHVVLLTYPLLSLSTASKAVRSSTWHNLVPALMTWHISSSQAFYMIYFNYYLCRAASVMYRDGYEVEATNKFIRMLPDFNEAFRCTEALPIDNATCS